ncbi:MAG: hypothetical protein E7554_04460 [Ruminococcaceae bacterium]|nr:hypothetical protein [Oscillospiraceae bacterium]
MEINGYFIDGELQSNNSGFSKWAFAQKDGKEYFIKEYLQPVYPVDTEAMSEELLSGRYRECYMYEQERLRCYEAVNRASRGGLVRIEEFFRMGSRYYVVMEKVCDSVSFEELQSVPLEDKMLLCRTIAFSMKCLHDVGLVHFDLKPTNILVRRTATGKYTAKLIDFDGSFFVHEGIPEDEEVNGDLTYLAPESFVRMYGEEARIGLAADIFSLGLVFHQLMCGELPAFDHDEYEYAFEAVLDGAELVVSDAIPVGFAEIIREMLSSAAEARPDIATVYAVLMGRKRPEPKIKSRLVSTTFSFTTATDLPETPAPRQEAPKVNSFFSSAGDL